MAGEICHLEGVISHDLMSIHQFIPNGVSLQITLHPNKADFCLMSKKSNRYAFEIHDIVLKVQFIEPSPSLLLGHAEAFKKSPAVFPFVKSMLKSFTIPKGVQNWSIDTLFANSIPDSLIIGLISTEAYVGKSTLNPFNFHHFDLTNLSFYIEGFPLNTAVYKPNCSKRQYPSEYLSLFEGRDHDSDLISYQDYRLGYTIYKINISDGVQRNYIGLMRQGQTRLQFTFKSPLPSTVTAICYGRTASILQIDAAKNILLT